MRLKKIPVFTPRLLILVNDWDEAGSGGPITDTINRSGESKMAEVKRFDPRELIESKLPGTLRTPGGDPIADRLSSVETALQEMRHEFREMREMFVERERKGALLVDAYKQVLADMDDLFEAQRHENIKREESIRFFLSSIESRLAADLRADLGLCAPDGSRKGVWPFRKAA